jgi:hypothetical protein
MKRLSKGGLNDLPGIVAFASFACRPRDAPMGRR